MIRPNIFFYDFCMAVHVVVDRMSALRSSLPGDGDDNNKTALIFLRPKAKILDVIRTKVVGVFLLAINSHLY